MLRIGLRSHCCYCHCVTLSAIAGLQSVIVTDLIVCGSDTDADADFPIDDYAAVVEIVFSMKHLRKKKILKNIVHHSDHGIDTPTSQTNSKRQFHAVSKSYFPFRRT